MAETDKWEKLDKARMNSAMEEIRKSANLRALMRNTMAILNPLGYQGGTPEEIQMQAGRHNAAVEFLGMLDEFDDTLWLEIQLEGIEERRTHDTGDDHEPSIE